MPFAMPADGSSGSFSVHRVIESDALAVREALRTLIDTAPLRDLTEEAQGTAQIVLAEALNNIVEHAYARYAGTIEVTLHLTASGLVCRILDRGLPMPGGILPEGRLADWQDETALPEGGFGWHLIRSLSQDLDYCRKDDCNLLSFRLELEQSFD